MSDQTPRELIQDNLRVGLTTENLLESVPPAMRVSWIGWNSGFRGSGLQIGDQIIAIDGKAITRPANMVELQRALRDLPGGLNESQVWVAKGLTDGSPLTLTIRRRRYPGEGWLLQDVTGKVRADRLYIYPSGRHAMGPTGPANLDRDGFDGAWAIWYEKRVFDWARVLDGGWSRGRFDTRMVLKDHLEEKARIDLLSAKYAGPFANTVRTDWETVRASLEGTRYVLAPEALDFRELEDVRVRRVAEVAAETWNAFLAQHAAEIIPAFPSVDPVRGDRSHVTGKLVKLGPIMPRQWLISVNVPYLATTEAGFWYFATAQSPMMRRIFRAMNRYKRFVSPTIREDVALIGRILPDPRMMMAQQGTVAGLEVEPVAALVGNAMFVDPSIVRGEDSPFAGEDDLKKQASELPPASAAPREVLEALIAALKANDQDTWNALFADWRNVPGEGRVLYYSYFPYPVANRDEDWIRSRRLVMSTILDVRVVWVSDPRVVLRGDEFVGAPRIQEVSAELEHIGLFDGEHRAFNIVATHRSWTLQRRDSGPWRISSHQGI